MTLLLVHGVPDTAAMWAPLTALLGRSDCVAVSLPGFGCPVPAGFDCSKEAYCGFLIAEIERAVKAKGGPIDVLGHDWGALLTVRAAALRPDLIASFAVANALPDPDYRWHRAARAWQTPGLGEFTMALSRFQDFEKALVAAGMPAEIAAAEKPHWTPVMCKAILALYRSAVDVGREWGADLSSLPNRGLVVWGADDPFVGVDVAQRFCARWGVELHLEAGVGHWALIARPEPFAARLKRLWA
jgi:pimeloyl-ACP methyl ester carboxylesterase